MINTDMIQNYLLWKRDKELYPPQWTPEDWAADVIMSEARVRIDLIKDLLENSPELDPLDFANEVHRIVYDPLQELMNGDTGLVSDEPASDLHQED
jgi:hypothetical protein